MSIELAKKLAYERHNGQKYDLHPYTYHLEGVAELAKKLWRRV